MSSKCNHSEAILIIGKAREKKLLWKILLYILAMKPSAIINAWNKIAEENKPYRIVSKEELAAPVRIPGFDNNKGSLTIDLSLAITFLLAVLTGSMSIGYHYGTQIIDFAAMVVESYGLI